MMAMAAGGVRLLAPSFWRTLHVRLVVFSVLAIAIVGCDARQSSLRVAPFLPAHIDIPDATNVIVNGGFETGRLAPWVACRSAKTLPPPEISRLHPHHGTYDAVAGKVSGGEFSGFTAV